MNFTRVAMLIFCQLGLAACTTVVTARRFESGSIAQGVHYYLPQPFILVTPASDGLKYQKLLLPDLDAEYTVDIRSYMTTYNSDIKVQGGLLQTVTLNVDNSAVATQLLKSTGQVVADKIAQIGQKSGTAASGLQKLADAPQTAASSISYLTQPGSILYKVVQRSDSIALVPVNTQQFITTIAPKAGPSAKLPAAILLATTIPEGESLQIPVPKNAPADYSITFPIAVSSTGSKVPLGNPEKDKNGTVFTIPTSNLTKGKYSLQVTVSGTINGAKQTDNPSLDFTIQ
jgi:hypothetical protein